MEIQNSITKLKLATKALLTRYFFYSARPSDSSQGGRNKNKKNKK